MEQTPKLIFLVPHNAIAISVRQAVKAHKIDGVSVQSADETDFNADEVPVLKMADGPHRFGADLQRIVAALNPTADENYDIGPYKLRRWERALFRQGVESSAEPIILTDLECDILIHLAQSEGQSVSRNELLQNVWGYNAAVETHTLETHIYRLRQKIEVDPSDPQILMTRDDGYCLA